MAASPIRSAGGHAINDTEMELEKAKDARLEDLRRYMERRPYIKVVEEHMSTDPKAFHYDAGGIETIKIIKAKLTPEQYLGYLLGNIIKYSCRANWKGDMQRDIEKAGLYQGLLAEVLEAEEVEPE